MNLKKRMEKAIEKCRYNSNTCIVNQRSPRAVDVFCPFNNPLDDCTYGIVDELFSEMCKVGKFSHFYAIKKEGLHIIFEKK